MFIAAMGKDAELVRTLLERVASDQIANPDDAKRAQNILDRAKRSYIDEEALVGKARSIRVNTMHGVKSAEHFDLYIAECVMRSTE